MAAPVTDALRYGSGAWARCPLSMTSSSTCAPKRSARQVSHALSLTDGAGPGADPVHGLRLDLIEDHRHGHGGAQRDERVDGPVRVGGQRVVGHHRAQRVRHDHPGLLVHLGLDAGAHPGAQVRLVHHQRQHVDRAVEGGLGGHLPERGDGVADLQTGDRLGHPGPRGLQLVVLGRAGMASEEVAVEADVDVAGVEVHTVMPQPVTHGGQPTRLELVGAPQFVEGPVDQDDACHGQLARWLVSL
jgi:hypothetical protein